MTPATPKLARGAIPKGSDDLGVLKALVACWNGFGILNGDSVHGDCQLNFWRLISFGFLDSV